MTEEDRTCITLRNTSQLNMVQHSTEGNNKKLQNNGGTFAVAFIPGKDTVLDAIAHQRSVDAHITVAEKGTALTWC